MFGKKGFFNGLITGSLIGTLVGAIFTPQRKPETRKRLEGQTMRLRSRARKVADKVTGGVNDLLKRER
ncbi:hypothetical protein SY88_19670 [Clostridiales bacterium PH28_bin88]|nr:hypothetical protein SY88_19670 [Clostridiales bacterium PH28_bin88]